MPRSVVRAVLASAVATALLMGPAPASGAKDAPTIETVAGGIPHGFPGPTVSVKPVGMDFDQAGNLFFSDPGNGVIWRLDPEGDLHHVAGSGVLCLPEPTPCWNEGGPAATAFLRAPAGLAVAPDGDIYVAEMRANVVRRIDSQTGIISTFAGTGETQYSPVHEGIQATEANLFLPQQLDMDSQGNLYIAEIGKRIRRVTPGGVITTVAGCGGQSWPDCFYHAQDGSPVEGTPIGANAGINGNGWGIAISPTDELYIADTAQIIKLDEANQVYRVVAGKSFEYASLPGQGENGPARDARFSVIVEMAFAPNGDLYLMEGGGSYSEPWSRIQKIEAPAGPDSIVRHVGGLGFGKGYSGDGGPAKQARFNLSQPGGTWTGQGMAVDPQGRGVFISDVRNERLRRIDTASGIVDTAAGNGYGGADYIFRTFNLTPSNGLVDGMTSRGGHSGDGRDATDAQLYFPVDVETDGFGNVYILEYGSHRVRKMTPDGKISTVVGTGCVGEDGCWADRISAPVGDGDLATKARLFEPMAIELDRTGTQLYIADSGHNSVRQVNMGSSTFTAWPLSKDPVTIQPGHIATVFGPGPTVTMPEGTPLFPTIRGCNLVKPYCGEGLPATQYSPAEVTGVATDSSGNLYVSDEGVGLVVRAEAATSTVTTVAGVGHATDCEGASDDGPGRTVRLCGPGDLDVAGGSLYVTETGYPGFADSLANGFDAASRIRRVDLSDPANPTSTVAGTGRLAFEGDGGPGSAASVALPHGVTVGPDGTIYIGDSGNSRIRAVAPDGTVTTVAGSGSFYGYYSHDGCAFAGDGGSPDEALLCAPMGLDVGRDGTLYVADAANNRIRAIRGL